MSDDICSSGRYLRLDADAVAATLERLRTRIAERFPGRNLNQVAAALDEPIREATNGATPTLWQQRIRLVCAALVVIIASLTVVAVWLATRDAVAVAETTRAFEWLDTVEAGINDVVFAGVAIYFLWSVPRRQARKATLEQLHRLRSLAHVIDMHQVSKDTDRWLFDADADTDSDELYLMFCAELLALVGKTAALHAEHNDDDVVLDTVAEIESLTSGTSREIWQKIQMLNSVRRTGI